MSIFADGNRGRTNMKKLAIIVALMSTPALAAEGTYTGEGKYISGRADTCMGTAWVLEVSGNQAHAKILPRTGRDRTRFADGIVNPDGTLSMSYVAPNDGSSRGVTIEGKFVGDSFEGRTESATCSYALKLQRQPG
jgi:hypothetical protein